MEAKISKKEDEYEETTEKDRLTPNAILRRNHSETKTPIVILHSFTGITWHEYINSCVFET